MSQAEKDRHLLRRRTRFGPLWTPAELAALHERYPAEGATLLARETGRTPAAVKQKALTRGLRCNGTVDVPRAVALWKEGHPTPEIARRLGDVTPSAVYHALRRAGEAGPGITPRRPTGTANPAFQAALRRQGYRSLLQRRRERWAYLSETDWTGCGCLTPLHRRLLAGLEAHGPCTARELAGSLKLVRTRRQNDYRRLHPLVQRGLVAAAGRRVEGRHGRPALWALAGAAAEAARRRRERADLE